MSTHMSGFPCSGRSTVGDTARLHTQDELHLPETKQNVINPFQSNFSATRILPSSYLFWAGKRLVGYL
jgi:hypothetical protein